MKTNALRILDKEKIQYKVLEYDVGDHEFDGKYVSDLLGLDYKSCYKTIALRNDHDIYICVISCADEIDLKKCAKNIGVKYLETVHVKELLNLVGYQRGSVTPIGVKKNKGIYFDSEVLNHEEIEISGGLMGVGIMVNRDDLLMLLNAKVIDMKE